MKNMTLSILISAMVVGSVISGILVVQHFYPENRFVVGMFQDKSNTLDLASNQMAASDQENLYAYLDESDLDVNVIDTMDIEPANEITEPTEVCFSANVAEGQDVYLLHYDGQEWETIEPTKVEDGYITATFHSLSPVAVVQDTGTASGDAVGGTVSEPQETYDTTEETYEEPAQTEKSEAVTDEKSQETDENDDSAASEKKDAGDTSDSSNDSDKSDKSDVRDSDDDLVTPEDEREIVDQDYEEPVTDEDSKTSGVLTYIYAGDLSFDGTGQIPTVIVKSDDRVLTLGSGYKLEYFNENLEEISVPIYEAGHYYVRATGIGNYEGSVTTEFEIQEIQVTSISLSDAVLRFYADSLGEGEESLTSTSDVTMTVTGQILGSSGSGASDITVSVDSGAYTAVTDSLGTFSIENITVGTHALSILYSSTELATMSVVATTDNVDITETYKKDGVSLSYTANVVSVGDAKTLILNVSGSLDSGVLTSGSSGSSSDDSSSSSSSSSSSEDSSSSSSSSSSSGSSSGSSKKTSSSSSSSSTGSSGTTKTSGTSPVTGDTVQAALPVLLAIFGMHAMGVGIARKRRFSEDDR